MQAIKRPSTPLEVLTLISECLACAETEDEALAAIMEAASDDPSILRALAGLALLRMGLSASANPSPRSL